MELVKVISRPISGKGETIIHGNDNNLFYNAYYGKVLTGCDILSGKIFYTSDKLEGSKKTIHYIDSKNIIYYDATESLYIHIEHDGNNMVKNGMNVISKMSSLPTFTSTCATTYSTSRTHVYRYKFKDTITIPDEMQTKNGIGTFPEIFCVIDEIIIVYNSISMKYYAYDFSEKELRSIVPNGININDMETFIKSLDYSHIHYKLNDLRRSNVDSFYLGDVFKDPKYIISNLKNDTRIIFTHYRTLMYYDNGKVTDLRKLYIPEQYELICHAYSHYSKTLIIHISSNVNGCKYLVFKM